MSIFTTVTIAAALILVQSSSSSSSSAPQPQLRGSPQPVQPAQPNRQAQAPSLFKFEKIYENQAVVILVDWSTRNSFLKEDGEIYAGAVYQILVKNPRQGSAASMISAFAMYCKEPKLMVLASKGYNAAGELISVSSVEMMSVENLNSPNGAIYKSLCNNPQKPYPANPAFVAPETNRNFWRI